MSAEGANDGSKTKFKPFFSKTLLVGLMTWLMAVGVGVLVCFNASEKVKQDFYQRGMAVTQEMAVKNRLALLDYNAGLVKPSAFSIDSAERAYAHKDVLEFAAIIDPNHKILAHTEPELIDSAFKTPENFKQVVNAGAVRIETGSIADQRKLVLFSYSVKVSGAKVGKVYLGLNASSVSQAILRHRLILGVAAILGIGVLFGIIWMRRPKPMDPQMIGPYRIKTEFADKGLIARGGMAELILAERKEGSFVKWVVIKRILPALIENSPEYAKLFDREAHLAVQLDDHPNIVKTLDYYQGEHAIVMEYIQGKTLADIFRTLNCPLSIEQAIFIILQVANGLQYAHTKSDRETGQPLNIIHRDIKPSNVLISYKGQVKISDFGIASAMTDPEATIAVGGIKGTLSYMSPEQAREEYVNNQSDLYSLGLIFHEMLVGNKVNDFNSDTSTMRAIMIVTESAIDPINHLRPDLPDKLNRIVMKCLAKEKKDRYFSARELIDDLISLKKQIGVTYDTSDMADFMMKHFQPEAGKDFDKTDLDASTVV